MKDKIKVCWVVPDVESYNTKWSMKTLFGLFQNNPNIDFSVIEYRNRTNWFFNVIYKKISHYFYCWYTPQDFYYRSQFKKTLKNNIKGKEDSDFYFFPALPCCIDLKELGCKGKVCLYTDCILSDLDRYRYNKPLKIVFSQYYKRKFKKDLKFTDIFFAQNSWTAEKLNHEYNVVNSRIYNIKFGVNLSFYDGVKNYSNNQLLIVLRKGGEMVKGYKLLLKALPLIRRRYPNVILNVVGTDYGEKVEGVHCYYNEPRSTTERLFKDCSLYVMPAHREPNGVTFLEGLANKTPIIGLNRFAFPEFCGNGEWGFIVEKEEKKALAKTVCEALSDPKKLEDMGVRGQNYVRTNYHWDLVFNEIMKVFEITINN